MSAKTDTEVIIGGKVFTLSGYESEEYLQSVASYIDGKIAEYNKVDSFRRLPGDTQSVLLQLNIADDYFKAKSQIVLLEEEVQKKEKERNDLEHELILSRVKIENMERYVQGLQEQLEESKKGAVPLQTGTDTIIVEHQVEAQ
ncbi:MAG: cell division protein ZapA [Lachnospiraceae bacterium]|nr:cell division protein ZapA [Lachnospiraceae bacterium]